MHKDFAATRIAAYGLVTDSDRLLLCRISERLRDHAGHWTLPGGGIDFGEDPTTAMIREVREETGLNVRSAGVAGIDSIVVPNGTHTTHSIRIVFNTEIVGGTLTNEVDGSTDRCEWHRVADIESLPIVDLVRAGLTFLG